MSNRTNNIAIGSFMVGALLLLFVLLMFFSGSNIFTTKERVVMYFDSSLQGLQIGAPVKLNGIDIGTVVDIEAAFLPNELTVVNIVTADIILSRIQLNSSEPTGDIFAALIDRGLRAQLNTQSLLTGLLYVELGFHPESPIRLLQLQTQYREFPTVETGFELLFEQIQEINIGEISRSLQSTLDSIEKLFTTKKVETAINDFSSAAVAVEQSANVIERLALNIDQEISQLGSSLDATLAGIDGLVNQATIEVPELGNDLTLTLKELRGAINEFNNITATIDDTFSEDSQLVDQLIRSAEAVGRAANSFRIFSELLQQQPEALIRGRRDN